MAEENGKIIGHIMFTRTKVGTTDILALAQLFILPECQKNGVGTALIKEWHRIARQLGYRYSVVLDSKNLPLHSQKEARPFHSSFFNSFG